eukprot:jgi/Botrbrau1/14033/Bobra.0310s0018.1
MFCFPFPTHRHHVPLFFSKMKNLGYPGYCYIDCKPSPGRIDCKFESPLNPERPCTYLHSATFSAYKLTKGFYCVLYTDIPRLRR